MIDRLPSVIGNLLHQRKRIVAAMLIVVWVAVAGNLGFTTRSAQGAGPFVVISDESNLGGGVFSGSVCYQVTRDADGAVISENCVASPATFAAPDGLEIGVPYTISVTLADPGCALLDDARVSDGSVPFYVRVNCDSSFLTATAAAQPTSTPTPQPTDTPTPPPTPTTSPEPSPTPTFVSPSPTFAPTRTPTAPVETATPLPDPTADGEVDTGEPDQQPPAAAIPGLRITDWQVQELTGLDGSSRLRGTLSYELVLASGGVSVVVDRAPTGLLLLAISEVDAGCQSSAIPLPTTLDSPATVAECAAGEGLLRQTLTFELLDASQPWAITLTAATAS